MTPQPDQPVQSPPPADRPAPPDPDPHQRLAELRDQLRHAPTKRRLHDYLRLRRTR